MSSFFRKRRMTTSSTEIRPASCTVPDHQGTPNPTDYRLPAAKRQRLIDATKVLLDIAKESSDWFPPLKSCLGGINALIKHCDVRSRRMIFFHFTDEIPQEIQDVKDKLEDLTPWVTKLKDGLVNTAAKGDHKEAERRTQLAKFASHLRSLTTITNLL